MLRALTAVSILALTITAAQAEEAGVDVRYGDLDLSKPSDVRVLQDRIQQAADTVCGPLLQPYPRSLYYRSWYNGCVQAASAQTVRRVEARTGQYRAFARN